MTDESKEPEENIAEEDLRVNKGYQPKDKIDPENAKPPEDGGSAAQEPQKGNEESS